MWEDWITRGIILAMLLWALKGYINERTKKTRVTDQSLSLGELTEHCKGEHAKLEKDLKGEVSHVRELIEKDLAHGEAKFKQMGECLDKHSSLLNTMNTNLLLIAQKVEVDPGLISKHDEHKG